MKTLWVIGIDPGLSGYLVRLRGPQVQWAPMPVTRYDRVRTIDYRGVKNLLCDWKPSAHAFLERVHPYAMSAQSAFSFGAGFAMVEVALRELEIPYTMVEPSKWMREMHQGVPANLKPKAKSLIALERRFPQFRSRVPANSKGVPYDGAVDALLLACWGECQIGLSRSGEDFY